MRITMMNTSRHAIAASALATLLMLCQPAGAAPTVEDDLRFLPADCQFLLLLHVDKALANREHLALPTDSGLGTFAKLEAEMEQQIRVQLGTDLANIERILVGGHGKGEPVEIIRLKQPVMAADVLAARRRPRSKDDKAAVYKEVRVGAASIYEPDRDDTDAFCIVDGAGVLLGRPKALRAALERGKRPEFSAEMTAALQLADFTPTFAAAFDLQGLRKSNPDALASFRPNGFDLDKLFAGATSGTLAIQFGPAFDVRLALRCGDAGAAKAAKERCYAGVVELARSLVKEKQTKKLAVELVQKARAAADGQIARVSLTLGAPSFLHLLFPG